MEKYWFSPTLDPALQLLRRTESITLWIEFTRNSQPQEERKTQHATFSGQFIAPWCDLEIRSFLQVWEFLHCEVYHGMRKKDCMLAGAIAQRLQCKGVKKSWQQCYQMLRDLKGLYWTVHEANKRPRMEPLGCPFGDALHKILRPRSGKKLSGQFIAPWCDLEIRSFLQVWEFLHCEVYHGMRKKDCMLAGAIAQRLQCKGVKKSWQQCYQMLRDLKGLYWTVHEANKRPRMEPLGCPFGDALHKILRPRSGKKLSGQFIAPWCDLEIRSFLQVWEFLHCEVYHGMRKKDCMLAGAIAQRLQCKGVKKSWQQCYQMLRDLKGLYWTVHEANKRPRMEPLGCPFGDALHKILRPRSGKKLSGQFIAPWCDLEIRSFLQVWEFLHCEVYHGMRKKDCMLAGAIAQRLQCKGVKKSWQQCYQMLRDLKGLYWTVHEANKRPRMEPLGCPFGDALHKILRPRSGKKLSGQFIAPWCDLEIRSFLQVWEFLHCEVYHGMRKKDCMLAGAIAQRLQCKGVKKSWQQCYQMLRDLKGLYWTVHEANKRPRMEPLGCPFGDALHKILRPRSGKKLSGQFIAPWCDLEIRSFLQVWEFLHCEVYHGMRKKDCMLAGAIAQRLQCKGVKKSWQQCYQMLRDLKGLYWTVHEANKRPRMEPLGCPFGDALHKILRPRSGKKLSGPPRAAAAGFLAHHPSQPLFLEDLPPVFHMEDPQVPKCEIWPMNLLCPISCLLPASLLGDPSPQQEWSTISNSDTYPEYRLF